MYNMLAFLRERYPDESKTWNFSTHSRSTSDNYAGFNYVGITDKIPSIAEVSWRADLQLLSAQYAVSKTLHGLAIGRHRIVTPDYDVFGFETFFNDEDVVTRRNLVLGKIVEVGAGVEVIPVPLPDGTKIAEFVFGHADFFMHEKITRIEDAERISRLNLIG